MTRITYTVSVEPVQVEGNGIPFGRRTMYAVKESIGEGLPSGSFPAYWTRRVAERVAWEKQQVMPRLLREEMRQMMRKIR